MVMADQKTIGSFEKVSFPEFGINDVVAKIDTGAYTGALHATNIHEEVIDGKPTLLFSPFDHPTTVYGTEKYAIRPVRSSNGHEEDRYSIHTKIQVEGESYPIRLTLADRSEMKWPVLIGRRFMRRNNLLVDVKKMNR
jgi:hypothetical protein